MSKNRLGTCKHCYQHQESWSMPAGKDPSVSSNWKHETLPESYSCQWLETALPLPPPIKKMHGAFSLSPRDCDACERYEPAAAIFDKPRGLSAGVEPDGEAP